MDTLNLMSNVLRLALLSYKGLNRNDAINTLKNKSFEQLENELKVSDWASYAVKMLNKYVLKENIYKDDISSLTNKPDFLSYMRGSEKVYSNYPSFFINNDDFFNDIVKAVKDFHDTKVYNNPLNVIEDCRSFRPISHKSFDDLTYEEFLRDLCFFATIEQSFTWSQQTFGKYTEEPFGKFEAKEIVKKAFLSYKDSIKDKIIKKSPVKKELKTLVVTSNVIVDQYNEELDYEALHLIGKNILIKNSFKNFKNLKQISVEGSIALIDDYSFINSEGVMVYEENKGLQYIKINDNSHYIFKYLNDFVYKNKSLKIHPDCKVIAGKAIQSKMLETLDISNVEFISEDGCRQSRNLKNVKMSEKLKIIDKCAFCITSIEEITFPRSLKFIGENIFSEFDDIKVVKVPKTCKVAKNAFYDTCEVIYY